MSTYPTESSGILNLDPATEQAIHHYGRRRNILLTLRAMAAAIVVFVAAMLLVAFCDYLFLMSDSVRWILSLAGYLASFAAAWWFGLRLIKDQDPRHLARRIESAEPVLREDLLSAVELADPQDANGSPIFRERLQGRVARRVSKLDVPRLLPVGLIRRWLSTGLLVLAVCLICLLFPSMQFGRRFARAMLPGIPIERASRTIVTIVEPTPPSSYVAEGDAVAVIVDISGESAEIVTLHWRTADGITGQTEMTPRVGLAADYSASGEDDSVSSASETEDARDFQTGELFAANLSVGSEPVEYRITAGDAITLWHVLTPLPRPRVALFTKRYEFPGYAKLTDRVEEDEYGDLKALMGTMAHLTVQFDEAVQEAVIQYGQQGADIPMKQADESGTRFSVSIPIKTAGQYQVDATSVRSGLSNPFSPTYTITPVIDAPPVVRWAPSIPRLQLVSPLDVLSLAGSIRDDLPVDRVIQEFHINGQPLQIRQVEFGDSAREIDPAWEWDLMRRGDGQQPTAKLSPGDIVRTRLVAIDRRANRGESQAIDLLIADDGFKADRHARIDELADLATEVIAWCESSGELANSINSIAHAPDGADLDELKKQLEELNLSSTTVLQKISEGLGLATTVQEAGLIELIGRTIKDIGRRHSLAAAMLSDVLQDPHESWQKTRDQTLRELQTAARKSGQQCDRLKEMTQAMIGQELSVAVMNDAISLKQSLRRMLDEEDPIPGLRFPRYLTVVKGRLQTIDQLITNYLGVIPTSTQSHFQGENWIRWSERWSVQFEKAIESPPGEKNYRALVRSFDEQIGGKIDYSMNDGRLPGMLTNTPKDLRNELGMVADWIRHAFASAMQARSVREKKAAESDSNTLAGFNRSEKFHETNYSRFVSAILEKAAGEEELHRQRPSVDLRYAADLGLLQRAIKNVTKDGFQPYRDEPAPEVFNNLTRAIQILEAVHEAELWQKELASLLESERRIKDMGTAKLQHPLWLERFSAGLEWPVRTLQNQNVAWELISPLDEARYNNDFNLARERITKRRWDRQEPLSAESAVEKINLHLQKSLAALQPEVTAARDTILRYVLTLPEQAREAADKAEEAQQRTNQREDSAEQTAQQLAEQQEEAEQAATETIELLNDQANTADITDAQQRELAEDADIAAAQIQEAVREAQQQMANAEAASNDQQRSQALEQTEQALQKLAETLDKTAEHFEKADSGEDITESRQDLREAAEAMELNEQLQQRFDKAEAMANAANSDPQELLRKLEEELQRNELMQQELSEISQQAADNAQRALEQAAKDEKSLNQTLERSDQSFQEQKRRAAKQIAELSQRASAVENAILSTSEQAVGWANDPESRPKLQQARQEIREAVSKANQMGGENALLSEMQQAAANMAQAVKNADQAIKEVQQNSEKKSAEDVHKDDGRRQQSQKSMERAADSLRNQLVQAQNPIRQQWLQTENDAKRRISQARAQARRAEDGMRRAEAQLSKNPENESLKQQVQQMQQQAENASRSAEAAEQTREFAEEKRKQAEQRAAELRKQSVPKLDRPNPAAQLAEETTKQAGAELDAIAKELSELGKQMNFEQQLQSPQSALQQLATRQDQVSEDVDDAAQDLARAARHEQRLGKEPASQMLQQAAESVQQNASQATEQAEQSLQAAARDAEASPEANQDVAKATEQIAQEAERLAGMLAQQSAQQAGSQSDQRPSEEDQRRAEQLAQTLDDLDRSLAAQAESQQQQGQPSPSQQASQQGQPQDGQAGQQQSQPSESQTAAESSPTLSSMMDAQNQQAARQRNQQMQAAQQGNQSQSQQPSQDPKGDTPANGLTQMPEGMELNSEFDRVDIDSDWGQLREQRTEDATESRSARVAPEYRREVEAYFRAIAKRAAEKAK